MSTCHVDVKHQKTLLLVAGVYFPAKNTLVPIVFASLICGRFVNGRARAEDTRITDAKFQIPKFSNGL